MRLLLCLMGLTLLVGTKIETGRLPQDVLQKEAKQRAARNAGQQAEQLSRERTAESLRNAIAKYEEALALWKEIGDDNNQASTLSSLGELYFSLGENRLALDVFNRALRLRRSLKDPRGERDALKNIGVVYFTLGEAQKAMEHYQLALPLPRDADNPEEEASLLNNIGAAYRVMGESQQALDYYRRALSLRQTIGEPGKLANSLSNLGAFYYRLGDPQQALDYYFQALPLRREAKDQKGEAITLTNIGAAHLALGEAQRALEFLDQAYSLTKGGHSRSEEAQALNFLGFTSYVLKDRPKAVEYFQQALKLWRAMEERQGEASALVGIGYVYREQGERQLALEHLEQALDLARAIGETNYQAVALAAIARVERDLNHLDQARSRIEAALELIESMRARARTDHLRASFLASKHSDYEFYIDLLVRLHERQPTAGFDALALEASEHARGRNLLETLRGIQAEIREGIDPVLLDRRRMLQRQINTQEQLRMQFIGGKRTEQAAAIEKELRSLLAEYQDIQGQILAHSPRYAALTDPARLKVAEIQQQMLDPNTLLLEYAIGEERGFLWAVTPTSLKVYPLPGRAVVEAAARRAYQRLVLSHQRQYTVSATQAAAELSRMVLGPVASELGRKRLVIVSDGALQYVPFGALPDPTTTHSAVSRQKPLIVDHEVVNLASASALMAMRREPNGSGRAARTVAVFSDPVFRPDDPRVRSLKPAGESADKELPARNREESETISTLVRSAKEAGVTNFERLIYTRREADAIFALIPPEQGFKALDFTASRAVAISAGLDQYRILHFATHGLLNSQHPELSGIVLSLVDEEGRAQEGFLRAHEIYNLKLNADLIVLSACSTALGKEIKGEGLVGLTRGFMYAGAPRVVASLWNVRDQATAVLMKRFYRNLLIGQSTPAAALRQAQVSMWREPRWAAPYYWAGFTMQGEWN